MAKRIRDTSRALRRIKDISTSLEQLDPSRIGEALGAKPSGTQTSAGGSPIGFYALRERLLSELVSSGGRPGRRGVVQRRKIPVTEEEWNTLKEVAEMMKTAGVNAAAGQIAGVLLRQGIEQLQRERDEITEAEAGDEGALDARVDRLMKAAASSGECPPGLRSVARELLLRMESARADGEDHGNRTE